METEAIRHPKNQLTCWYVVVLVYADFNFIGVGKSLRYITIFGVSEDKQMTTKVFKECFAEGYEGPNDVKFDSS